MPEHQSSSPSGPPLTAIERPRCPKCQTRMSLTRISPGPSGYDVRTFECSKCEHIVQEMISNDPMKSADTGWLAGELRPPK